MRNRPWGVLVLAILAAWSAPVRTASAEEERMVPEAGAIQVMLLRQKSVREDLHLTPEESKKIEDFTSQQWEKAQKIHELKDRDEQDRKYEALSKENEKFLDQVLEPSERQRLNEITLQKAGLAWITRPEIASKLGLTAEQKEKAAQLQKEARKEMHDVLHSDASSEVKHNRLKAHHDALQKRLMDLLTDEQEVKWKEMSGAPFKGELRFEPHD